jgi:cytochrome c oxidase subunit 2
MLFWKLTMCGLVVIGGSYTAIWDSAQCERLSPTIPSPYRIEITGSKKSWSARYPDEAGRQTVRGAQSAGKVLHAPLGTKVVLVLKSTDYVYTFAIPQYGIKEIAVPGLEFQIELDGSKPANLDLIGEELCGRPHSEVAGRLVIEPPNHFFNWRDCQS